MRNSHLNTKWNLPQTYEEGEAALLLREKMPTVAAFRFIEGEKLERISYPSFSFEGKEKEKWVGPLEEELLTRVAMCKFITIRQLHEFMHLAGIQITREKVEKRVKKLVRCHVLRECHLTVPEDMNVMHNFHCYQLGRLGHEFAKDLGVHFHKGNMYCADDTAFDVKRILVANQIVLGLLKSHVSMKRFGIMETFRPICDDQSCYDGANNMLFRPTMNVQVDDYSILAFEVIRDDPEYYESMASKYKRYLNLVKGRQYGESNYHDYKEVPQIIYCGESLEHNRKVKKYLEEKGLWDQGITILFTEDLLNIQDTSRSIYELTADNQQMWYELPVKEIQKHRAA